MKSVLRRASRSHVASRLIVAIVAAAVLSPLLGVTAPAEVAEPGPELISTRSGHPYSDPKWYPLRSSEMDFHSKWDRGPYSSLVACVYSNCSFKSNDPHGYWAIDFAGDHGDNVYAAGAGKFHVGLRDGSCRTKGGGTWAWIDHGGGVVSRYHHLATITAEDGQWVTPATRIATMGPGKERGCDPYYLHFEVRRNGVRGDRYNMGQLKACEGDLRVQYPRALDPDFRTWDHVPYRDRDGAVPQVHSGCIPSVPSTPNRPAWTKANRGNNSVKLSWAAPSRRINRVTVRVEPYRPSMGSYGRPYFRRFNANDRQATVSNLDGGRTYRLSVSFHNKHGNSKWGDKKVATPY